MDYVVSSIRDAATGVTVSREDNEQKEQAYRDGKLQVLINVNILTEGVDIPKTGTVFLARPTVSIWMFRNPHCTVSDTAGKEVLGGKDKSAAYHHWQVPFPEDLTGCIDLLWCQYRRACQRVRTEETVIFADAGQRIGVQIHLDVTGERGDKIRKFEELFRGIVAAGDQRNADCHIRMVSSGIACISQNLSVVGARVLLVQFWGEKLNIKHEMINQRKEACKNFRIAVTTGFNSGVKFIGLAGFQQCQREFRLGQYLAPGQRYAAGLPIKRPVLQASLNHVLNGYQLSIYTHGIDGTMFRAQQAVGALTVVNYPAQRCSRNSTCRANLVACTTANAGFGIVQYLGNSPLRFWIKAPPASQRTAFEEYSRTDAGAVVGGKALDLENISVG